MHLNANDDRMVMDGNIVHAKFNNRADAAWYLANRNRPQELAGFHADKVAALEAQLEHERGRASALGEEVVERGQALANVEAARTVALAERDLERARADKAEAALAAEKAKSKKDKKSKPAETVASEPIKHDENVGRGGIVEG